MFRHTLSVFNQIITNDHTFQFTFEKECDQRKIHLIQISDHILFQLQMGRLVD